MTIRLFAALLMLILTPAALSACDGGASDAPGGSAGDAAGESAAGADGASDASGAGAPEGGQPAAGDAGAAGAVDASAATTEGLGVPVISSGTAQPYVAEPEPVAPEEAGRSRRVAEAELPGLVRFTLFEPSFLPAESYTVAPIITEPEADGPTEGLPSVATGYTVADQHSLAYVQSPAGEGPMPVGDGTAEEITVRGQPATLYEDSVGRFLIVWEEGDTRLVVKSHGLERDVVLQVAEGLAPKE